MSLTNLRIHFTNRSDKAVYVTRALLSQLKLSGVKHLRLSVGQHSLEAPIRLIRKSGNHLYLSTNLRRQLMVPRAGSCFAIKDVANNIRIGPRISSMKQCRPYLR